MLRSFGRAIGIQILISALVLSICPNLLYAAGKFDYFEAPTGQERAAAEKAIKLAALKWVAERAIHRKLVLVRFPKELKAEENFYLEQLRKTFQEVKFQSYSEKAFKQLSGKSTYPDVISPPYEVKWQTKDTVKVSVAWESEPGDYLDWGLRIRKIDGEWKVVKELYQGMSKVEPSLENGLPNWSRILKAPFAPLMPLPVVSRA